MYTTHPLQRRKKSSAVRGKFVSPLLPDIFEYNDGEVSWPESRDSTPSNFSTEEYKSRCFSTRKSAIRRQQGLGNGIRSPSSDRSSGKARDSDMEARLLDRVGNEVEDQTGIVGFGIKKSKEPVFHDLNVGTLNCQLPGAISLIHD